MRRNLRRIDACAMRCRVTSRRSYSGRKMAHPMRGPVASRFMKQEALIGRTIAGKFEIEALVGQGAMGAVYRARQVTLGTTLAIKVLHRQLAGDPMFAARFLREAQAASRVDHPSSMRVIDFGEEPDGLLYIAMEYVEGQDPRADHRRRVARCRSRASSTSHVRRSRRSPSRTTSASSIAI